MGYSTCCAMNYPWAAVTFGGLPALSCSAWDSSALFFPLSQLLPAFIKYVFTEVPLVSSEEPPSGPAVVPQSDLAAPHWSCPSSCQQLAKHTQERWVQPSPTPWLNEVDFDVLVHKTTENETHSCWNCQEHVGCCHRAEMPTWVSQFSNTLTCRLPMLGLLGWKKVQETRVIFIS